MANSYFQFKQFLIHQDRCAMKLSTDAVLLGALARQLSPEKILDVGMGTGVIGLMLAQRYPTSLVHGVEIEVEAFSQASENIQGSPWGQRVEIFNTSFQDYSNTTTQKYDLIVSNPPYFSNHLKSAIQSRNIALHDGQLSQKELLVGVKQLLSEEGLFWLILPVREMKLFVALAQYSKLCVLDRYLIRDRPESKPHREICSFGKGVEKGERLGKITLKENSGQYSQVYKELVKDFLLNH